METLFFREKRVFALALLIILSVGISSLLTIGRQEDPTITNIFAFITTPYPGASPERVEALVTEKIEAELREIAEIDQIDSVSRTGVSSITIELSEFISKERIEQTWSEIRDAIADAALEFPPGVPEPTFNNDRVSAFTSISAIVARDDMDVPKSILVRYAEELRDRIRDLQGTRYVRLYGEPEEEILVEIDRYQLAALSLTVDQVSNAIARADVKVEAGRVSGGDSDYLIELSGEIESLERIREVPLVTGDSGVAVRVGDIAEVARVLRDPPESLAFANGVPAIVVAARMEPDLQVDTWIETVKREIAEFEQQLPAGLEHQLLFDQSLYTWERLGELSRNLMIGMGLVIAVLLITLGWRAAMIVAIMLPLASLLSISLLQRFGIPIQQMSVTGLIVALGLLVDAAIVMTDDVKQRLAAGTEPLQAVRSGVRRLTVPLLASTVTTVLAFLPMVLLPGPVGDFIGSIAISVIVMLVTSFLLALTIAPALAGMLLPYAPEGVRRRWWRDGLGGGALARFFASSLDLSLRYRAVAILAALALPLIGFGAFPTLTAQFFPGVERDQFYVQVTLEDGAAIAQTRSVTERIDEVFARDADIVDVHWFLGESAPAFYYNMQANRERIPGFAEALITTASNEATHRLVADLQTALDAAAPEAQIIVRELVQGPPVAAPVEMRLVGPSLAILRTLGDEARRRLSTLPAVTHTRADLMGAGPKLVVDVDEDKVRLAGLELADVARQLDSQLEGVTGGSLIEGTEELPVRVRLATAERATADRVAALTIVPPPDGSETGAGMLSAIPLSALGEVQLLPSESAITRRDGERVNTVQAYLQPGVLPEEALADFKAELAANPLVLPDGYRIEWGGDSDARAETMRNLLSPIGLVITLMIACIVLTFNSFRLSLIAWIVTVLSMGLSLLALAVFQYPFGFQALLGVIGSIGVSINAAIIIMSALQEDPDANAGDRVAIRNVVMKASRHIVSTTVTTFGGFLPLILAGGGFWPPFAMAISGGVLLSTVVSFYFVPPMFSLFVRKNRDAREVAAPKDAMTSRPLMLQAAE